MSNKTCGECKHYIAMNRCVLHGQFVHDDDCCGGYAPKTPLTNGDRIRQLSNEELIKFKERAWCFYCTYHVDGGGRFTENCNKPAEKTCADGAKEWFNAPAGKDNNVPAKESKV